MIRASRLITWACALLSAAIACNSTPTSPSQNVPYSQTDLVVGTGATAATGNRATVTYTGWLYDSSKTDNKGTQFDAGSFSFVLGAGTVIRGFDQGVTGMKVGGIRRVVIPPDLGYGSSGANGIPPNSALVFEVTLTAVS